MRPAHKNIWKESGAAGNESAGSSHRRRQPILRLVPPTRSPSPPPTGRPRPPAQQRVQAPLGTQAKQMQTAPHPLPPTQLCRQFFQLAVQRRPLLTRHDHMPVKLEALAPGHFLHHPKSHQPVTEPQGRTARHRYRAAPEHRCQPHRWRQRILRKEKPHRPLYQPTLVHRCRRGAATPSTPATRTKLER